MSGVDLVSMILGPVIMIVLVVASRTVRAILKESVFHPFRSAVLEISNDHVKVHVVSGERSHADAPR